MNKFKISKRKNLKWAIILGAVCLFCPGGREGFAQEGKLDINALIQETQQTSQEMNTMTFVWWIPEEFWQVSFDQDPTVTDAQAEEILTVLRPYTLIAVVDGAIGSFGGVNYRPESEVRAGIKIKDSKGMVYSPFEGDEINPDTKNFLGMMRPVLVNMLGPMGQNMHFFLFPANNKKGQKIAEAKEEGAFFVAVGGEEFRWKLPLSSLIPPTTCPQCKEKCSGAWKFCPWCGGKLLKD